jgi:glutathione S-transferase
MEYLEVEEAIERPGLRLALTAGVPGPWGESAKYILRVKNIPYAPVRQLGGLPNEALKRWTGMDNAPIAVYENERPRAGWAEILLLAERLAPQPSLVPADARERALLFGLAHEICGEQGLGWTRRLTMVHDMLSADPPLPEPIRRIAGTLGRKYGYSPEAAAGANERVAAILAVLAAQLREQGARGSRYFLGERLSALDLYWAAFSNLVDPLPPELCPLPRGLRRVYTLRDARAKAALDPALLEHREFVFRQHLDLPLDF